MELDEILRQTKGMIQEYAGSDPDRFFYANRYVFARLQLLERQEKVGIKKRLLASGAKCHGCDGAIASPKDIVLHRLDGKRAYSQENCVLMHQECHQRFHAEHPSDNGGHKLQRVNSDQSSIKILTKTSRKYDNQAFLYWWDITPNSAEKLTQYDLIEFVKKDTGECCCLPPAAIIGFLTEDRQTSRQNGNWGIRVQRDKEDALAFEPGCNASAWLYLPVVWTQHDSDTEHND